MRNKKPNLFLFLSLLLSLFVSVTSARVLAQDQVATSLFVTGSEVSSPPLVDLHVYGLDVQGQPLDLSQQMLSVQHNGLPSGQAVVSGSHKGGTFTLFLIDIPPGVAEQLPAIQGAIEQFASTPTMEENTDAVAVYKVGETAATRLLAPDTFHNSVRNLFATPLEPEIGATALADSLGGLLEQIDSLKPNSDMVPSIVVMTDGTDVVSANFQPENIAAKASGLGIPVHTIWLTNENLSTPGQQFGQDFLAEVAAETRGLTARLQDTADLATLWNRIASFREQTVVSYAVDSLAGGEYPVELSLDGSLVARAEATVNVPGNLPTIAVNLPEESRELSLPDLEKPVKLHFPTELSWLDGEERELVAAQLFINEAPYDIPVEDIAQFDIDVDNLTFDTNTVRLAVLDSQGLRVTSPPIQLTVTEGAKSLPPEMEPGGGLGGVLSRVLLLLLAILGLGAAIFFAWRQGWLSRVPVAMPRGPSRPRPPVVQITEPDVEESYQPQQNLARLEVLEAVTRMPAEFSLGKTVVQIGRSPNQVDVAFENDITVSRLHASLHLEGSHYRIFDERSTIGVWVNDQQVPEYGIQLMDGDEIHLGAVHLRYRQP